MKALDAVSLKKVKTAANAAQDFYYSDYKDLGDFIELEKLTTEETSYGVVSGELWEIMYNLGIGHSDEVTKGYDVLIVER